MESTIEYLAEVTSTNDIARESRFGHGDVVWAERQSAGRGQRGNNWESEQGKNLTFSIVLNPGFLPIANQFLLSEIVSLAITDMMAEYGINASVKWPNDIYAGHKKIAGILIENDIKGSVMYRSVVGIGLNVNQTEFDPSLPNPVSMSLVTGDKYNRREVMDNYLIALGKRYDALFNGDIKGIESDYHHRLFRVGQPAKYILPNGVSFTGTIQHVLQSGELVIQREDGTTVSFLFKEVEFA